MNIFMWEEFLYCTSQNTEIRFFFPKIANTPAIACQLNNFNLYLQFMESCQVMRSTFFPSFLLLLFLFLLEMQTYLKELLIKD